MRRPVVFLANHSVPKPVRERFLRGLRQAGFEPKPFVADPLQRCHALLEFLRHAEKDCIALFVCLDTSEAMLARIVAGHAQGPVYAVLQATDGEKLVLPREELAPAPYATVVPSTPEALISYLTKISVSSTTETNKTRAEVGVSPAHAERAPSVTGRRTFSEEDAEWLARLASDFRPRLREEIRQPLNVAKQASLDFSHELRQIISHARNLAERRRDEFVTPLHYLAAIAGFPECAGYELLREMGVALETLVERVLASLPPAEAPAPCTFAPSEEATALVACSKRVARQRNRRALTTVDLVEGMAQQTESLAATILAEFGATAEMIAARLAELSIREEQPPEEADSGKSPAPLPVIDAEKVRQLERKFVATQRVPVEQGDATKIPEQVSPPKAEPLSHDATEVVSVLKSQNQPEDIDLVGERKTPLVLKCDPQNPPLEVVEEAADSLLEGKLVAFPTETVYGLGVDATNLSALERLYEVKGRERTRAIALLIHSISQLRYVVRDIPEGVHALMEQFWPGPLTIVFRRHPNVFASLAPDDSIGIRMPDHYVALAILSMVGRPIATTSANLSGQAPAREASEILAQLGTNVDVIVDAGRSGDQPASTVLSVIEKPYRILRPGPITAAQIEEVARVPVVKEP
ncbi:MAG: L-threonylcarbamoyladenylate synthase [Candidatus Sumerlaeaceae bacterium]